MRPVSRPNLVSPPRVALTDDKLLESVVNRLRGQFPSEFVQDFAADVLIKCLAPGSDSGDCGPSLTFSLISRKRVIAVTASTLTRHHWLQRKVDKKVDEISTNLRQMTNTPTTIDAFMYSLAKDVGNFLKIQRKRSSFVLDHNMSRLWRRWEDPFTGKSFNRFHSVFCTIHNYVHLYHMAGRMSDKDNPTIYAATYQAD